MAKIRAESRAAEVLGKAKAFAESRRIVAENEAEIIKSTVET